MSCSPAHKNKHAFKTHTKDPRKKHGPGCCALLLCIYGALKRCQSRVVALWLMCCWCCNRHVVEIVAMWCRHGIDDVRTWMGSRPENQGVTEAASQRHVSESSQSCTVDSCSPGHSASWMTGSRPESRASRRLPRRGMSADQVRVVRWILVPRDALLHG